MKIAAPAKINLGLQVFDRRPDGYHDLESILQQISLSDCLTFQATQSPGWCFECSHPEIDGEDNLVCRAARLLEKLAEKELPGVAITLFKNIPIGSGLGGGSSDAAAALRGLNIFWKLGFSFRELECLGASLGSDIPFFLQGGTALARGRGEIITPLTPLPFFWVVLALPPRLSISTASVYGSLDKNISSVPSLDILRGAITGNRREDILNWFNTGEVNSLQPLVLNRYPRLCRLQNRMKKLGLKPVMSGSGPAFFALTGSYLLSSEAALALQAEGYRAILCWTAQETAINYY